MKEYGVNTGALLHVSNHGVHLLVDFGVQGDAFRSGRFSWVVECLTNFTSIGEDGYEKCATSQLSVETSHSPCPTLPRRDNHRSPREAKYVLTRGLTMNWNYFDIHGAQIKRGPSKKGNSSLKTILPALLWSSFFPKPESTQDIAPTMFGLLGKYSFVKRPIQLCM